MIEGRVVSIVDDDESVRQAVDGLLRSAGLPAVTFASAEEFLRSEHLRSTACLIVDLQMPGMDGLQLQERLGRDGHRIPTVILTAHADHGSRDRVLRAGAAAFLQKSVNGDVLLSVVESLLGRP
jgi:two-component system, LuxR family, response regulator FixJ